MRLLVDLERAQGTQRFTRAGRYALRLARALGRTAHRTSSVELHVLLDEALHDSASEVRRFLADSIPPERIHGFFSVGGAQGQSSTSRGRHAFSDEIRAMRISALRPDLVLILGTTEDHANVCAVPPLPAEIPVALLLHDVAPLEDDPSARERCATQPRMSRRADLLLAASVATAHHAAARLAANPSDIFVVGNAVDPSFRSDPPARDAEVVMHRLGITKPFVLYTGSFASSSDVEHLVAAFVSLDASVRNGRQLVLAGHAGGNVAGRVASLAEASGIASGTVVSAGHVTDENLRCLYQCCELVALPGTNDGAIAALLEAVACGARVLTVRSEATQSLVEDAMLIDPGPDAFRWGLRNALADRGSGRTAATLTTVDLPSRWEDVADKTLRRLRRLVDDDGERRPVQAAPAAPRPRLAVVSPLPPATSGIADYCVELLPALARHYEVEIVVDQDSVDLSCIPAGIEVRNVKWFEGEAEKFDRILYHFGNSPFHRHMFGLVERFPGVVVLHDFFLSDLLAWIQNQYPFPDVFDQAVAHSHGAAGRLLVDRSGFEAAMLALPCSLRVLEMADAVIVHSRHAIGLARAHYGAAIARRLVPVPFPRASHVLPNEAKAKAREALGIASHAYVISSFGMIAPQKLTHVVIAAITALPSALRDQCVLVLVGASVTTDYGVGIAQAAETAPFIIRIPGQVSAEDYRRYLAAADICVQLRAGSRGETSAAVFDALGAGLPLIVNDHGSLAELPEDAVVRVPDEIDSAELAEVIATLLEDSQRIAALGNAGRELVSTHHDPEVVGARYACVIETGILQSHRRRAALLEQRALAWIGSSPRPPTPPIDLAIAVSHAIAAPRKMRLFVDVTAIASTDLKTGIQRTVRALLLELLRCEPEGYRVELVRADRAARVYRYAHRYLDKLLDRKGPSSPEEVVATTSGDLFLGLDLSGETVGRMAEWFRQQNDLGVRIAFVVYDILPVRMKEMFPTGMDIDFKIWLEAVVKVADMVMCISNAVAGDLIEWLDEHRPIRCAPLRIGSFPLGADLAASAPSRGLPAEAPALLDAAASRRSFLMVGTVEPRKGHEQVLSAVEALWASGDDVALVIVGKPGWMMDRFAMRVTSHVEFGRRLFWPQNVSDEFLEAIYPVCTALIAASRGEGFGLPLIEAAQHHIDVVARDIKVFREVAGEHAYYFRGESGEVLAEELRAWLALRAQGLAPRSEGLRWYSWEDSAQQLVRSLIGGERQREWHFDQSVRLGEPLRFDSMMLLWEGWSQTEDAYRWNDGRRARIGFIAPSPCPPNSHLTLCIGTFGSQDVSLSVNGVHLFREKGDMADRRLELVIPPDTIVAGERNWIYFDLPDAKAPGGGDDRLLALYIRSLMFA